MTLAPTVTPAPRADQMTLAVGARGSQGGSDENAGILIIISTLGPPRAGKSMLACRLTTILPAMTWAEAIDTTRIHRVAGLTGDRAVLVTTRPFRAPHHTVSEVGPIGGGQVPTPGGCRWPTTAFSFWTNCRSAGATSAMPCGSRSTMKWLQSPVRRYLHRL